jgi:NRAMP (natural resistance-associated macrophage protein)-like metal ion transporter
VANKPNSSRLSPSASKSPIWKILRQLGPGLITGASDDDPSGIATYSQVGAQFGFGLLWVMPFSYPLMAAIQEICARIGRVTGKGIAANVRGNYPRAVLVGLVLLLLVANTFNLGADIGAMASAAKLIVAGPAWLYIVFFGGFTLVLQIFVPYTRYVVYLKWLTLALFAYIATGFVLGQPKWDAIRATFWPSIRLSGEYFTSLIAVLGTTISPYLFFWQASEEAEDVAIERKSRPLNQAPEQSTNQLRRIRIDTYAGMAISNIVAFFIILATAATLHAHGITRIDTADQAALALKPFAGKFAFLLFALGIVGTGLLAVPVLAASAAYAVSETFGWPASLEKKPRQAVRFYATIAAATLVGLMLNFVNINPIKALFWSAVLNGVAAVPLMILIMLTASNRKIMGKFALPLVLRIGGWLATLVMLLALLGMLIGSRD